jgi:hypothetical protein
VQLLRALSTAAELPCSPATCAWTKPGVQKLQKQVPHYVTNTGLLAARAMTSSTVLEDGKRRALAQEVGVEEQTSWYDDYAKSLWGRHPTCSPTPPQGQVSHQPSLRHCLPARLPRPCAQPAHAQ